MTRVDPLQVRSHPLAPPLISEDETPLCEFCNDSGVRSYLHFAGPLGEFISSELCICRKGLNP